MIKKLTAVLLASAFAASPAAAQFADSFTTPGAPDPTKWESNQTGQIVASPDGGNALNFAGTNSGTDLTSFAFNLAAGEYRVNVDYLCANAQTGLCGGYIGLIGAFGTTDGWFASDDDAGYPVDYTLVGGTTTSFNTNSFTFTLAGGSYRFKLEDFLGAPTAGNVPADAFFRNLSISAVPEPAAWALMTLGFGAIGATMRRRRAAVRTRVRFA